MSGGCAQIFSATSFCTRRTMRSGRRCPLNKNLTSRREVMLYGMLAMILYGSVGRGVVSASDSTIVTFFAFSGFSERLSRSTGRMEVSFSIVMTCFACFASSVVRMPVPGPISRMVSVGAILPASTIVASVFSFTRKF